METTPREMRAKVRVGSVIPHGNGTETLSLYGVAKIGSYASDGADEDNNFAKFTPSADFRMLIANPALVGTFEVGQTFYVDFIPVG